MADVQSHKGDDSCYEATDEMGHHRDFEGLTLSFSRWYVKT